MSSTAIDEGAPLPSHTASLSETAVKDVDHVLSREYRLVVPSVIYALFFIGVQGTSCRAL